MAVGLLASQRSTYADYGPSLVVDGDAWAVVSRDTCTQTAAESQPWWAVDLGSPYYIRAVSILSRVDCCSEWWEDVT